MRVQVTLGIWQATGAQDIIGKVFGVYFPVLAFVAIGGHPTHANTDCTNAKQAICASYA